MNRINVGRVLLGGLVAGLVISIGNFLMNRVLLRDAVNVEFSRLHVAEPGSDFIAKAVVMTFVLGIAIGPSCAVADVQADQATIWSRGEDRDLRRIDRLVFCLPLHEGTTWHGIGDAYGSHREGDCVGADCLCNRGHRRRVVVQRMTTAIRLIAIR